MRALVLVDIQNDFLPGGALEVRSGDAVIPVANRLQSSIPLVVATQDYHPADHASFAVQHPGRRPGDRVRVAGLEQTLWPVHCVQGTPGAELAASLDRSRLTAVFRKGTDREIDSYSGFFDNGHRKSTGLADYLRERGVREIVLAGLATDYCVKFTALDGCRLGFRTVVVEDGCRGVDLEAGDVERALDEMRAAGVLVKTSRELEGSVEGLSSPRQGQ